MVTPTDARTLIERSRDDPAFFWDSVLGAEPYPKQLEIIQALKDHQRVAVVGCNGCLGAETRIDNADTGESVPVGEITKPMPVWSYSSEGVVRAIAEVPFIKGRADLYRVATDDGRSFVATGEHRLLTGIGWRQVSHLSVGSRVLSLTDSSCGE